MPWHRFVFAFYARWCTFQAHFMCGMTDFMREVYGRFLVWHDWDTRLFFCILRALMHIPSTFYVRHDWFHVWDTCQILCVTWLRYTNFLLCDMPEVCSLTCDMTEIDDLFLCEDTITIHDWFHVWHEWNGTHVIGYLNARWRTFQAHFMCDMTDFMGV